MTHWNYRLMVKKPKSGYWFEIHEIYYDEKGKPRAYSEEPAYPCGNNIEDILFDIENFKGALNEPIYWHGKKFPEIFDYDKEMKNK